MAYPFSHQSFTPPSRRDHRNNRTSDESNRDRFPPTPTFSFSPPYNNAPGTSSPFNSSGFSSSLYNSVPRTAASPFDSSRSRTSFLSSNRRINNDSILNRDTFDNIVHPDFIPNFYQSFKTLSPHMFTPEVHENVTKVLKHIIFQGQEGQKFYKTHCDRARHELSRKEQEIRALRINEEVARDNMEKYFKNEIAVHLKKIKHLEACLSKEKETSAHLREESKTQRTRIAQTQMQKPYQDELKRVNDKYQKLLGKKKFDNNSIKTLKEEIYRLKKVYDSLVKEKRHAEELLNKEKGRCNELDEKYQQFQYDTNMLKDEVEELNESIQSLQKDIEKKNEQLDRKKKAADSLAKMVKECCVMTVKSKKEKRGKLIEELKAAKSLLKEQKGINAENIALLNASNNENDVMNDRIEDYKKEIQGLREQLSGRKRAQSPTDKENVESKKSKPSSQCENPSLQSDTIAPSSSEDYI